MKKGHLKLKPIEPKTITYPTRSLSEQLENDSSYPASKKQLSPMTSPLTSPPMYICRCSKSNPILSIWYTRIFEIDLQFCLLPDRSQLENWSLAPVKCIFFRDQIRSTMYLRFKERRCRSNEDVFCPIGIVRKKHWRRNLPVIGTTRCASLSQTTWLALWKWRHKQSVQCYTSSL